MQADDEMGHTILGDVTNPAPVIVAGGGDSGLKTLLILSLGGLLGAGGIAGGAAAMYFANRPESVPVVEPVNTDISVGLGRIEDYLKD